MASNDQNWSNLNSDGTIVLDDGSVFKIHKALLSAHSDYFKTLFEWHTDQKEFHLKVYVSKEAMEQILSWIYSHNLTLTTFQMS